METKTLQQQLTDIIESGVSANRIAGSLGISAATLSGWLRGTYAGTMERVAELVQNFIDKEKEKRLLAKKGYKYVHTTQSKRIYESFRMCHLEEEIGVIYGDAGCGKTTACKHYADKHKDTILIESDLGYTAKILFKELHKRLGYDGKGTIHDMFEDVTGKLTGTGRFIIIDEAEHLPYRALELLRRLYDKAGIGIALTGMPQLVFNLRGKRGEYAQLYSRVGIACKVLELKQKDVEQIVATYMPGSNGIWKEFYTECNKNARLLAKLIYRSQRIAQINECDVDSKVVKAAAEMLLV